MASITPITAYQNAQQSTSSLSPVDASCETGALADGVDYLICYHGQVGGNDTSTVPAMRLMHGAAVVAEVAGEGRGLAQHWDSVQCQGYAKVTGDGSSTLKFQFWCITSSDTAYAGAMSIVAIPLSNLVLNTDYWFSGTSGASNEVTNATLDGWDTLRSAAFTLPDDGDYLVLMSAEAAASDAGGTTNAWMLRYYVDSTEVCPTESGVGYLEEWEDNNDWNGVAVASLVTGLTAGSRTFKIECGSRGAAESDFRRSNIWVFRKASFDQIIQTRDTTGDDTTSTSFVDFTGLNTTYTPNQQEYVMVLGHVVIGNDSTQTTTAELYNNSDSQEFCVDAGEYNNDSGFDTARDLVPAVLMYCGQYSTDKNWKVRYRVDGSTGCIGRDRSNAAGIESNLIFWGLTTAAEEGPSHASGQLGCNW